VFPTSSTKKPSASLIRVPCGGGEIARISIGEDRLTRSAFYLSPFEEAAVLVVDSLGSGTIGRMNGLVN
jgi:hypothetical protein